MRTKFLTEKSGLIKFLIFSTILVLLGLISYFCFMVSMLNAETIIAGIISGLVIVLLLWIWFGTYYQLSKDKLVAASGPFVWNIKIRDIDFIRLNQNTFGGMYKATLSMNGMEIRYKNNLWPTAARSRAWLTAQTHSASPSAKPRPNVS